MSAANESLKQMAYEYLWDEVMSRTRSKQGERRVMTPCCFRQLYVVYPDGDYYTGDQDPCVDCQGRGAPPENILELIGKFYADIARAEAEVWS